ncbi:MAG: DUF2905 domain-containing protein [Candidatus Omnitrophota bacterium]|nr:MAG: DUF2905 domain-containing protein [Candidatus Omnitrophota bacterium]
MSNFGKLLIVFGMIITGLGLILFLSGKLPFIGKLPGDIIVEKKNFTFYFPLATSLLLSLLISLIIWLKSGR